MRKRKNQDIPISLSHLTFEEAVAGLVRDAPVADRDAPPKQKDSEAEESDSTKADDPEAGPLEKQTAPGPTPSVGSA